MKAVQSPAPAGRLVFLDLIRVVAVLSIILFHFHPAAFMAGAAPETVPVLTFLRQPLGDLGVTLFIIVSATALMTSTATRFSISDFYVKRFLTIFPSYWISYVVVAVLLFASRGNWAAGVAPWKFAFTVPALDGFLFHGRSSYYLVGEWFIGFILCLYAVFPILRRGAIDRPVLTTCMLGVAFVLLHSYYDQFFTLLENRNPLLRLPEFFFGLCFLLYVRPCMRKWGIASAAVLAVMTFWAPPLSMQTYGILLGIACFCFMTAVAESSRIPSSVASFLGTASRYSFLAFLVHHQIIQAVRARLHAPLGLAMTALLFASVVVASFAAAALLMPLVDRFSNFLRRQLQPGAVRKRTILTGASTLLVLLVGGLAWDISARSPSMDRKLAALSSRMASASPELNGMALTIDRPRYAEAFGRWARDKGLGVYGSRWWPQVGTVRYSERARNDKLCTGRVDLFTPSGPQRGAQGWVTVSPPTADVLIVLTDDRGETVGYGVSGAARPDVARAVRGARRDSGWMAIANAQPAMAYAYVDGSFCKL